MCTATAAYMYIFCVMLSGAIKRLLLFHWKPSTSFQHPHTQHDRISDSCVRAIHAATSMQKSDKTVASRSYNAVLGTSELDTRG